MNNKGFTMVELLVAMSIMGLLIIMAFPTMRAIQFNNNKKKYEAYGETVVSSAKLYVDSYSEDLFEPYEKNGLKLIELSDIKKKGLLNDINLSGSSCINGQSNVVVVKYNNDYAYCLNLVCTNKNDTNAELYRSDNKKGSCASFKRADVTYKYGEHTKTYSVLVGDDSYKLLSPYQVGFDKYLKDDKFEFDKWDIGDVGQIISIDGDIEINLVGHAYTYKIKYDKSINEATGIVEDTDCTCGIDCPIRYNNYNLKGHTFENWKYNNIIINEGDNAKDSIETIIDHDGQTIHLSSYFRKNTMKINYYTNGGYLVSSGQSGLVHIVSLNYDSESLKTYGLANHKGGSLDMKRKGYFANDIYHVGTKDNPLIVNENTSFTKTQNLAAAIGKLTDFENGDIEVNLYAGWDLDTRVSTKETIKVFHYKYNRRKCELDTMYSSDSHKGPWREYKFYTWLCVCKINSAGIYTGSLDGNPEFKADTHINNTMEIFYNNTDDGVKSCNGAKGYYINQNVATLCLNSDFKFDKDSNVAGYHGYRWYKNNEGISGYHNLEDGWYHSGSNPEKRYKGVAPSGPNDLKNVKGACDFSCEILYP